MCEAHLMPKGQQNKQLFFFFTLVWIVHPSLSSLFSPYLPTQVNDTTVNLPVAGESGAAEVVNVSATSKPLPGDAEGGEETAACRGNDGCVLHLKILPFVSSQWTPLLQQSPRPADFHVSPRRAAPSAALGKDVRRKCSCLESLL